MGQGPVRTREWLKEASWSLLQSFILSTHRVGSNERGDVRNHGGPPKILSYKSQDPTDARMAGKSGRMSPFQDRGMGRVRDTPTPGVPLGTLHLTDLVLYTPDECSL